MVMPEKLLVLPSVAYGYTEHVMDFPDTINDDFEHFMHHVLDITKSLRMNSSCAGGRVLPQALRSSDGSIEMVGHAALL